MSAMNSEAHATDEYKERLGEAINQAIAHTKYCLSAKACQGILNRAKRRSKELPEMLRIALEQQAQSASKETDAENLTKGTDI